MVLLRFRILLLFSKRGAAFEKGFISSGVANEVDDMFRLDKSVKLKSTSVYRGRFSGVLRCSLGAASYKIFDTSSVTEGTKTLSTADELIEGLVIEVDETAIVPSSVVEEPVMLWELFTGLSVT
ncbi:hypothetical protein HHI36_016816 [Cryptolaemus montrouzieri]|uniref:Uncharacterized protein n=1 Tax=Cryptolaemus montrouzieri TaxID=559131 RepID=A0ABD2NKU1_9CUCU